MSRYLLFISISLLCLAAPSCKIGKTVDNFDKITREVDTVGTHVDSLMAELLPVDTLMMNLVSGVLAELASDKSEKNLDTISARINRILTKYLNETFQNLDPGPIGKKLVDGALDPLLAAETEERIKQLISGLSDQISRDLAKVIDDLTSPANKAKLNSMITSLLSEANSAAISAFINRSLQGIQFDSLGQRIAEDLVIRNLSPSIDTLTRSAVRSIFAEIKKDDNANGFFKNIRNIILLGLGLLGTIIGLFSWRNRRKTANLNRMLINAIEDLDDKTGTDVKKHVEKKARQEGLLPELDKVLEQEHLLKRKPGR